MGAKISNAPPSLHTHTRCFSVFPVKVSTKVTSQNFDSSNLKIKNKRNISTVAIGKMKKKCKYFGKKANLRANWKKV